MFQSLVSKAPQISITVEDESITLRPAIDPALPPTQVDPILRGTVSLELSSPRAVKKIKVFLEGLCDVLGGVGYPYESTQCLYKELEIDLKGEVLEKGTHALNFSFIIPNSTATYQRSTYGRCRHFVKASAEFAGKLQPTVSSPSVAIWVSASNAAPGDILLTQFPMHSVSDDLGPVALLVSSPHLTVASLLHVKAELIAPPADATIVSIQTVIEQSFIISYNDPNMMSAPPTERHVLAKVGPSAKPAPFLPPSLSSSCALDNASTNSTQATSTSTSSSGSPSLSSSSAASSSTRASSVSPARSRSPRRAQETIRSKYLGVGGEPIQGDPKPLHALSAGEPFTYSRTMRVPDDDYCRPSTLEGSDGRIRVSHVLAVEIRYRVDGESEDKLLKLSKPVTIQTCCGLGDAVDLPCYTRSAPKTVIRPVGGRCLCNLSLKQMLDRDGEQLQRAGSIVVDPNAPPLAVGADRQNKSPALTEIERWRLGGLGDIETA